MPFFPFFFDRNKSTVQTAMEEIIEIKQSKKYQGHEHPRQ
jgi:hypothetical protein